MLTINAENELEILPVEVLRSEPKQVYISSGIEAGAKVITTILDAPVPGTKLTTEQAQAKAQPANEDGDGS